MSQSPIHKESGSCTSKQGLFALPPSGPHTRQVHTSEANTPSSSNVPRLIESKGFTKLLRLDPKELQEQLEQSVNATCSVEQITPPAAAKNQHSFFNNRREAVQQELQQPTNRELRAQLALNVCQFSSVLTAQGNPRTVLNELNKRLPAREKDTKLIHQSAYNEENSSTMLTR